VAGFSPEFVDKCIFESDMDEKSCIIDPFAGCGTTMVEANIQGIPSIGFEAHYFLANICRSKLLFDIDISFIEEIRQELCKINPQEDLISRYPVAARSFLEKVIPECSLSVLVTARDKIGAYRGEKFEMAYLILSRVLDLCSHSKTDGIYKAPSSKKKAIEYDDAIEYMCDIISEDLNSMQNNKIANKAKLFPQSSEDMSCLKPHICDLLVTSPPYLNNFDYAEMTRMHLYFWLHASNWSEISQKIRSKLIVNTTTALKGHKDKIDLYRSNTPKCTHEILDQYMAILSQKRKIKPGKKEYDYLIYPYFYQITNVLKCSNLVLRNNAPAHIIISDAAFYGTHIKTQEILAAIMEDIGFVNISIKKLRDRGSRWILDKREGTQEGLGEYQITGYADHTKEVNDVRNLQKFAL